MLTPATWIRPVLLLGLLILLGACKKDDPSPIVINNPDPLRLIIDTEKTYQDIAGFGGASRMWGTRFLEAEEAQKAFGLGEEELGLSIFRIRIAPNESEWPNIVEAARDAYNRGVTILASPWSPPANLKSNNSEIGGDLPPESFEAYKNHLNRYVQFMADNGIVIHAISLQNEPDIQVGYESCDWTSSRMAQFLREYGDQITGTRIAAPESFNFDPNFTNNLLNDSEVASKIDIVAGHIYGGGLNAFPLAEQLNKEIWMTEYLLNLNVGQSGAPGWSTYDEKIKWDESLDMLTSIHEAMELNWNAYIWWYLRRYYSFLGDGEQGTTNGEILKRGYAFSHFSKFIRPGYTRIDAEINRTNNLLATAYKKDQQIVAVIINASDEATTNLHLELDRANSAEAYITDQNRNRTPFPTEIQENAVIVDIMPRSVTTLVITL